MRNELGEGLQHAAANIPHVAGRLWSGKSRCGAVGRAGADAAGSGCEECCWRRLRGCCLLGRILSAFLAASPGTLLDMQQAGLPSTIDGDLWTADESV